MNNQRSKTEQMMLMLMLALGASLLYQQFFGAPTKPPGPVRQAPALSKAFVGIAPGNGETLSETAARAEVTKLQQEINTNGEDEYSYWARLRSGLIQQYVLQNLEKKKKSSGFMGMGPQVQYYPVYDEIMLRGALDAIDAQATYQQGDLLWRESTAAANSLPSPEAATTIEQLIHKGRIAAAFFNHEIYVPRQPESGAKLFDLPAAFELRKVGDLRRTAGNPNPPGILERIDRYYSTTFFHKLFTSVAAFFGNNPSYSFGLTILLFALVTRLMVQPLNKKQYESMKGMALIAPEMKKIQEKYKPKDGQKPDPQAQMQLMAEMRALNQRHGVNPMMGCGLAIVQMPIFFLVVLPFIQHNEPKLEMVGASFGWINNLAYPDIPLLIIYGISMLLSFRLSTTPPADDMQRQQQAIMSFIFPVLLPFFMKSYSSAFILYWIAYNILSTILQYRMMKAADPEKSVIKTLMGTPATPVVEAVPPRPTGSKNSGDAKSGAAKSEPVTALATKKAASAVEAVKTNSANGKVMNGTSDHDDDGEEAEESSLSTSTTNGVATAPKGSTTHHSQQRNSQRNGQRTRRRRKH